MDQEGTIVMRLPSAVLVIFEQVIGDGFLTGLASEVGPDNEPGRIKIGLKTENRWKVKKKYDFINSC